MVKLKRIISFIFFVLFIFLASFSSVKALEVFPIRQTVVLDPGTKQLVTLQVENNEDRKIIVEPNVDTFIIDSETGQAIFGQEGIAQSWISSEVSELILLPGEKKTLSFIVSVPANAPQGAHYLGLFAKTKNSDAQVSFGSRVGTLLFLHVAGTVTEDVVREVFKSDKKWYKDGVAKFRLTLRNNGSIHVVPFGELIVKNQRGDVILKELYNNKGIKMLPGTLWRHEFKTENFSSRDIGRLTASLKVSYGETNQVIIDQVSFWYIPVWLFLFGVFFLVIFVGILIIHALKNRQNETNS